MGQFERSIQGRTVKRIEQTWERAWVRVKHGTVFGKVGDPDIYGCVPDVRGGTARFFGLEVKNEDGELSAAQIYTLQQLLRAGAICGGVQSPDEAIEIIQRGLYEWRKA